MLRPIAVALAFSLAPAAFAQTYLVASGDCGAITLHAAHGDRFPDLGEPIDVDRLQTANVSNSPSHGMNPDWPAHRESLKPSAASHSLDFPTTVSPEDGVVMASVDSKPVISGNETRTEHAKTLIFCGPTPPMADWVRSANLGLEIYPQAWNPGRRYLKTGDTMWFIAVDQTTKPQRLLRDASMQLVREGGTVVAEGVPNHNGGYDFAVPEPGRYMVTTTERRPDPKQPEHWLVDTSSLTFDIR